jgi:hypothetical protein
MAGGIQLMIGASGMGKTFGLTRIVEAHAKRGWRVVVVDVKREWHRQSKIGVIVSGPNGAREAIKRGAKVIVWQAGTAIGDRPDANAACAFALEKGAGTLIAIPEAHIHYPLGPVPPLESVEVFTGYRHRGISVVADSQRLVAMSMMLRNNLDSAFIFGTTGPRDLDELKAWGGVALADAAQECAARRRKGEPGWHVRFDPMMGACGPYKLERFK